MRSISRLLPAAVLPMLLIAGCDKPSTAPEQANETVANTVSSDEAAAPSPDEAAPTATPTPDSGVDVIGKLDRSHKGAMAPGAGFTGPDGASTTLAAFRGKPVLLNLWATWCGPCVGEMPTLEKIAAEGKVAVVTVSQDPQGVAKVGPYFAKAGFKSLKQYLDPPLAMSAALDNPSLPTSVLYDASGHEVWRMTGGMDWTSPTAHDLLAEAK